MRIKLKPTFYRFTGVDGNYTHGRNDNGEMKKGMLNSSTSLFILVGVQGFEPWTPWSQTRCATGLRHTPKNFLNYLRFTYFVLTFYFLITHFMSN